MKTSQIKILLLMSGAITVVTGCESNGNYDNHDREAGLFSPSFPPTPATPQNTPESGAAAN
jgi:hypothetical protein